MPDIILPVKKTLLSKDTMGLITFYNNMGLTRGITMQPHLIPVCMGLMDERIQRLLIIIGPGAGKSYLLSVCFPAFMMGHDQLITILGVSAGENLPQGFMKAVMNWIEFSPEWKAMFPNVVPDKDAGWSTERGMFIRGHNPGDPDASYFAAGLTSSALTGKHARLHLWDDLHNRENSATEDQCLKVRLTYYDTLLGRADPRGARFIGAGRRWHQEDIYGHLKDSGQFVVMELPAQRDGETEIYWDITIPDGLECCFNSGENSVANTVII